MESIGICPIFRFIHNDLHAQFNAKCIDQNKNATKLLTDFLNQHKTNTSDATHTSMKGGKFNIPPEHLHEFYQLYSKSLLNNSFMPNITEKHPPKASPVVIDLDFRLKHCARTYDINHLSHTIVHRLLDEAKQLFDIPEYNLVAYCFARQLPYTSKDTHKDGIHIILPEICLSYDNQYVLRNKLLPAFQKILEPYNFNNQIDDIYDKAVIQKNNWLMFGSNKPDTVTNPYQLIAAHQMINNNLEKINSFPSPLDLPEYLSIQKSIDEFIPSTIIEDSPMPLDTKLESKKKKTHSNHSKNMQTAPSQSTNVSENEMATINSFLQTIQDFPPVYSLEPIKMTKKEMDDTYFFISLKDKFCMFADREHKRSSPTQFLQISQKGYCIKCYNEECTNKSYPSKPIKLPMDVYAKLFGEDETINLHAPTTLVVPNNISNETFSNVISGVLKSMRIKFPKNKLEMAGEHSMVSDDSGNQYYVVPLLDKYNPIDRTENEDNSISGQISQQGFSVISYTDNETYGQVFPKIPMEINPKYSNILFVNLTVNNNVCNNVTTINNYYNSEHSEFVTFETDHMKIKLFDDLNVNKTFLEGLSCTHYDVAKAAFVLTKDKFRCANVEKQIWYHWDGHYWVNGGTDKIISFISEDLVKFYLMAHREYINLYQKEKTPEYQKKIKNVEDLTKKLKTASFKNYVLSECSYIFHNYASDFMKRLDDNHSLIAFKNGVMNLESMEFRNGLQEDCISFSTGVDYIPYEFGKNKDLETFLQQILPEASKRTYVLKLLASCLSGSTADEKFYIWTGSGGNGKSKLIELMDKSIGAYSFKLPISLITQKRQSSNQASPELVVSKGKRFGTFQEPSENEKLNIGLMKELTGGDKITCRALYKEQMEFKPQFKLILCCNQLPEINSSDGGTWRRLRVVEFTSKFVEIPNPANPNEFEMDPSLNAKMEEWKQDFLGLLVEYYKLLKKEGNKEPAEVMKYTNQYKSVSDPFAEWFNDHFILSNDAADFVIAHEAYQMYKDETGEKLSQKEFALLISRMNVIRRQKKVHGETKRGYQIKIKED